MLEKFFARAGKIFGTEETTPVKEKPSMTEVLSVAEEEVLTKQGTVSEEITYMKAFRIHEKDGSFTFEDQEPRRSCVYDVVNLKLPKGAAILDFGGAPDVLKRIRLSNNEYTHLDTAESEPVLVAEAVKDGIGLATTRYTKLEYIPLQEELVCDFEELCRQTSPDNIYHVNYSNGRYHFTDLYGSRIITKQEALRYQAEWS